MTQNPNKVFNGFIGNKEQKWLLNYNMPLHFKYG